jgi:RNA polymerase sigma factor (sigma-70 family)
VVSDPTQSFEAFYRDHFDPVVAYVIKFGADLAEAEDAVQNAMELLWRHPEAVRHPAAWVRVVARNNWMRAMRRHAHAAPAGIACEDVEPGVTSSASAADPADVVRQRAEQRDAARAIQSLPRTQREILALVFDGYRPAEIAEIMGKKASAVRSNLAHARRQLGRRLAGRHGPRRGVNAAA